MFFLSSILITFLMLIHLNKLLVMMCLSQTASSVTAAILRILVEICWK